MVEVKSSLVTDLRMCSVKKEQRDLCAEKMLLLNVIPIRQLVTSDCPVTNFCLPTYVDIVKDWFDGGQVDARAALYVDVGDIFNTINILETVLSDCKWRF